MVGISVLALGAGSAAAQTTTNTSEVSQTGANNSSAVDNNRPGNDQNRSTILQNGRDNRATVLQVGDFNASQIRQIGDGSAVVHTQRGNIHRAESLQTGNASGSAIRQAGEFNNGSVTQDGDRNVSRIAQGIDAGANSNFDTPGFFDPLNGVARAGNANRAVVSQVGDDLSSTVRQRAGASGVAASDNVANVRQRGRGNSSNIVQESRGNAAQILQFEGGTTAETRNSSSVTQQNTSATAADNPLSNNRANVAVTGQGNTSVLTQNGRNNVARLSQGLGVANRTQISQIGTGDSNRVAVGQYGSRNAITIGQDTVAGNAVVWQQIAGSNSSVEIQQGTGTTGSAAFSAGFFNNTAPTGAQTRNLTANVTQGNNREPAGFNVAQIGQDGTDLAATVRQQGTGTADLPNIVRVAQQGGGNSAAAIQRSGVGPSSSSDTAPTGQPGDPFFFGGGARSAEINILQSGSNNSATVEQRGKGQFARIEQGPGSGNVASIIQDVNATNATAIIRQAGSNNSYNVTQSDANQYILVSQTGSNNSVTDVVRRGPGS